MSTSRESWDFIGKESKVVEGVQARSEHDQTAPVENPSGNHEKRKLERKRREKQLEDNHNKMWTESAREWEQSLK